MRYAALALSAALLVGCTSGDGRPSYAAADYRGGECATSSRVVFAVREEARDVVDGEMRPADAVGKMKAHQAELIQAVAGMADPAVKGSAQDVVDAVGFYRIGVDAGTFAPKLATDVQTSAESFLAACST